MRAIVSFSHCFSVQLFSGGGQKSLKNCHFQTRWMSDVTANSR
jgi:hypothetical protein